MARMPRVVVPGFPHHVTQRGNRRQKTFFCDDNYRYYIELLSTYANRTERRSGPMLSEAHRRYTRHVNFREGWRGRSFRPKSKRFLSIPSNGEDGRRKIDLSPFQRSLEISS
jgi:putative transposase